MFVIVLLVLALTGAGAYSWLWRAYRYSNYTPRPKPDAPTETSGVRFPQADGFNLESEPLSLPADFAGTLNVVILAYIQWQQSQVNTWLPPLERLQAQYPDVAVYELPVIEDRSVLAKAFIDAGMRLGVPNREIRRKTVTLYLDVSTFNEALQVDHTDVIHILLLDADGTVLWREVGEYNTLKGDALTVEVGKRLS